MHQGIFPTKLDQGDFGWRCAPFLVLHLKWTNGPSIFLGTLAVQAFEHFTSSGNYGSDVHTRINNAPSSVRAAGQTGLDTHQHILWDMIWLS